MLYLYSSKTFYLNHRNYIILKNYINTFNEHLKNPLILQGMPYRRLHSQYLQSFKIRGQKMILNWFYYSFKKHLKSIVKLNKLYKMEAI